METVLALLVGAISILAFCFLWAGFIWVAKKIDLITWMEKIEWIEPPILLGGFVYFAWILGKYILEVI